MNLTKTVLKRPVTTVMVILCLIVFGLTSVFSSKLELIPSMDMPMLIVMATYLGASPDDVDQLVVQPIQDETGTLTDFAPSPAITHKGEAELAMPCTSMLLDSILPAIVAVMLLNSTWLSYASFALS